MTNVTIDQSELGDEREHDIRENERNMVLDELESFAASFNYHLYPEEMLEKIATLRPKGYVSRYNLINILKNMSTKKGVQR
jgi:hypothetical protein